MNNVLTAKNHFLGGLKPPKIAPESKNAIFSKCEIMIPQSNLGKRKVKLMLVRPQKGFTTTTVVSEKNNTRIKKSKFAIFSKAKVVVVKSF